ncbi:MAG: ion transporter [Eubacterium sp.]|nr:ion transporter [Eubacterium sp.]
MGLETRKKRIYEIVEASHKNDNASHIYDVMILVAVVAGLIPLMMKADNQYTKTIDLVTSLIFLCDYILRVYTADYKMGVKSYVAYAAYLFSPMAIIDLLSIVPILGFIFPLSKTIPLFRIFRVFRIAKLIRYSRTMIIITNVIRKVKRELFAVLVLSLIYIIAVAMIMFQIEPDIFDNFLEAIYWSTVSITTIGYGDVVPQTLVGQFITMISALVGVAVIALPSGIITAAYMEEIHRKKKGYEL